MTASLERLLRPRSIAVLGGSWARNVIEQCEKAGFSGDIWPVHPTRDEINGVPCYRSIGELPASPDATFIGVNRHLTIDVVEELRAVDAGGAVCFASGFSEAEALTGDGISLQTALIEAAGDMPVLGPNCYGLINYLDGALLWPDQHGGERIGETGRGVALVMQSSNIAINCTMQARGLPLAYVMCTGNQACVDASAIVDGLLDDDRVTAIGMHIEGLADISAFERVALKARRLRKPIVAIKVGRSEQAREASLSHTASVAGSDAGSQAFFRQLGIPLLDSLPQLLETLKLLHVHGALPGRTLSSMSCSGGEASLVADTIADHDLEFRPLDDAEKQRVQDTLSELVVPANPLDYHTFIWGDEAALTKTFSTMLGCGFDLNLLILDFPRRDRCSDHDWDPTVAAISNAAATTGQRAAVVTSLSESLPEHRAAEFLAAGIAPLHGLDEALAAAAAAATIGEAWASPAPELWNRAPAQNPRPETLTELQAKLTLQQAGIRIPDAREVSSANDAIAAANAVGYPVVMKSVGMAHKSEHNGVRVSIRDDAAAKEAWSNLSNLADAVLVEQMVENVVVELIVGAHKDPVYGYLLTVGAGGVLVELLDDVRTLRMPVSDASIREALGSLRIAPLLAGYRGKPSADIDAVVEAILQLQGYVELNEVTEIDINPLMVLHAGLGAVAADALIIR